MLTRQSAKKATTADKPKSKVVKPKPKLPIKPQPSVKSQPYVKPQHSVKLLMAD